MEFQSEMAALTAEKMKAAISLVNKQGYAALDLPNEYHLALGEALYHAVDSVTLHPNRDTYYNEITFYWPEDWFDVEHGICSFHDEKSLRSIYPANVAQKILIDKIGESHTEAIFEFASQIKHLVIENHHGLQNNELRLARVIVRQMNENQQTQHSGASIHEDIGYSDRAYQQLLSVIATTYGIPTRADRYQAKLGELLIFNAYDRRRLLSMSQDLAFYHEGPKSGPKMFFFFEFLGPRN